MEYSKYEWCIIIGKGSSRNKERIKIEDGYLFKACYLLFLFIQLKNILDSVISYYYS